MFNGAIDRHPAVVARVTGPADVAAALAFAQANALEVAVRGGGHSTAGSAVRRRPDDRPQGLRQVAVDPSDRRARAGGGALSLSSTPPPRSTDSPCPADHQPHRRRRASPLAAGWAGCRAARAVASTISSRAEIVTRRRPDPAAPRRRRTPTCSGRSAVAAATSASSPSSSSGCTRSARWSTSGSCSGSSTRALRCSARPRGRPRPAGDCNVFLGGSTPRPRRSCRRSTTSRPASRCWSGLGDPMTSHAELTSAGGALPPAVRDGHADALRRAAAVFDEATPGGCTRTRRRPVYAELTDEVIEAIVSTSRASGTSLRGYLCLLPGRGPTARPTRTPTAFGGRRAPASAPILGAIASDAGVLLPIAWAPGRAGTPSALSALERGYVNGMAEAG